MKDSLLCSGSQSPGLAVIADDCTQHNVIIQITAGEMRFCLKFHLTFQSKELHLLGDLWIWKSSSRSQIEAVHSS